MWGKRIVGAGMLCAALVFGAIPVQGAGGVLASQAKGAVVMDADNGRVYYTKDGDRRLPMASTTKIMTALLTLEQPGLDIPFTVDQKAIHVEGSSMGLREGDTVTLRALAYGMLLSSGNDAANAAAVRIAGDKKRFSELMNQRAQEYGMEDTHFVTPSGLDDPEHYSTARDMAVLAREALQNSDFREICGKTSAKVSFGNPPYDRWLTNHNRLLKLYSRAYGVKTGFTDTSGRCLVSAAQEGPVHLIAVTLGCPDDWNVHMQLYDAYFQQLVGAEPDLPQVKIPVAGTGSSVAATWTGESYTAYGDEAIQMTVTAEPFLFAPVKKGRLLGEAVICSKRDGTVLARWELTASRDVPEPEEKKSWWQSLLTH